MITPHVLAIADDLSGAAETASLLVSRTTRIRIVLGRAPLTQLAGKGGVEIGSMIEALRQATQMSTATV